MTFYAVTSPTEPGWSLDVSHLRSVLAGTPHNQILEDQSSETRWLVWRTGDHPDVELSIDRNGKVLYLRGPIEDAAAEALAFLRFVPADGAAVFFDESYTASVDLREATSVPSIVAPWLK
jgi:hypothetical protein